jgi:hypothetical protein
MEHTIFEKKRLHKKVKNGFDFFFSFSFFFCQISKKRDKTKVNKNLCFEDFYSLRLKILKNFKKFASGLYHNSTRKK